MSEASRSAWPSGGGSEPGGQVIELRSALLHPRATEALLGAFGDPSPVVVVFADLVGFTALSDTHGDAVAIRLLDEFSAAMRELAVTFGMTEVKTMGDGFLLTSRNRARALEFAAAALEETAAHDGWLGLRLGLHAGPVIERNGDVFGRTVNVASRVVSLAEEGEALVSVDTLNGAPAPVGSAVKRVGRRRLRNVSAPVELFSLRPVEAVALVTDPVCRMKLQPGTSPSIAVGRRIYYFCSEDCRESFERAPRRYAPRTCLLTGRYKKRWKPGGMAAQWH
jgi:adenylate cyclase